MKKKLLALLAAALLTLPLPAAASCAGGACDDVILPGEGQTVVYLPVLSGEGR